MYYKIVERFGLERGKEWLDYLEWRGLALTSFDSVDGSLRFDLFEPESTRDFQNSVNEDFKTSLITNLEFARSVIDRYENAMIVGVDIELDASYVAGKGLLGYDIVDAYCDVSLVTNWGSDTKGVIGDIVGSNGLIADLPTALKTRDALRAKYGEDPHAEKCEVWAIYDVGN